MQEMWVRSLGQEDPLEEEKAAHSSILTLEILWTEEPGGLQSMGLQRAGRDSAAKQHNNNSAISCTDEWEDYFSYLGKGRVVPGSGSPPTSWPFMVGLGTGTAPVGVSFSICPCTTMSVH